MAIGVLDVTLDEAINTVLYLLSGRCGTVNKATVCNLLKLECIKTNGTLPLALLTFLVASTILDTHAVELASKGVVTVDVLKVDYTKQSSELRQIAKEYRKQVEELKVLFIQPVAVVAMVEHCIQPLEALYASYCCTTDVKKLCEPVNPCMFECCTEC